MQAGDFEGLRKTKLGEEPAAEAGVEAEGSGGGGSGVGRGARRGRSKRWRAGPALSVAGGKAAGGDVHGGVWGGGDAAGVVRQPIH